jgi:hypothetical protein
MHWYTKLYIAGGLAFLVLWGLGESVGFFNPAFGLGRDIDTSSRQGYWYTYRRQTYDAGPGRSPGGHGGSYGGGGYSGGK